MPLRIDLLAVGEIDHPGLRSATEEYLRRLGRYARVGYRHAPGEPLPTRLTPAAIQRVRAVEGKRLLRMLAPGTYAVALDPGGRQVSSEDIARWLNERATAGDSRIAFLVGGTLGLDPDVLSRCRERWSLSRLTFPHQMVPLIVLEQLYRGFRILRGEPYHY
ncbi:MAG: 23S rRNA (pseudouridine(1915)-N(3))-methyltransferase RlmH [Symbiobacteriaceae bacterium]